MPKISTMVTKSPVIREAPARVDVKMDGSRAMVEKRKNRNGLILSKPAAQVKRSFGVPGIKRAEKQFFQNGFHLAQTTSFAACPDQ